MSFAAAGSRSVLYQWLHSKLDTKKEIASREIIVLHAPYIYIFNH